jgi:cephalosporin hydroxylase
MAHREESFWPSGAVMDRVDYHDDGHTVTYRRFDEHGNVLLERVSDLRGSPGTRLTGLRARVRDAVGPLGVARAKRLVAPVLAGDLTRLGQFYGTNKAKYNQRYTVMYEQHLMQWRKEPCRLLEIGIGGYGAGLHAGGSSLRMWRTWLRKATIVGVDLDARDLREPRICTRAGDQADAGFLRRLHDELGPFDIIIDDGSHMNAHVLATFDVLWPLLNRGGCYVIEDTGTSYLPEFGGGPPGTGGTSMEMVKSLVDLPTQGGDVEAVHVHPHIVFVVKRP